MPAGMMQAGASPCATRPLAIRTGAGARIRSAGPGVVVAASRPNWRAEIEGGSDAASGGSGRSSTPSGSGSSSSSSSSSGGAVASTSAAQAAPAAAATLPRPRQAQPQAQAQQQGQPQAPLQAQQQPEQPAAAEGGRPDPVSLPTFDLMEYLSVPKHQATAFGALAATSAILSVLCCVEPEAVLDLALPKADDSDLDVTFVRIIGVTLAASASVEYSLKHAAESQLLRSATYQRLMAGLAAKSAGFLAVLLINSPATFGLWNGGAYLAYLTTAVAAGAINLSVISHTSGSGLVFPGVDPNLPQNASSWGYTACVALYLLTAAACFAPETLFLGDPYSAVTPLVKGVWAPGFLLAAVMAYVLKDAADRNRLGASTFKNLNLGLASLEYGYAIIFGSAILSDQVDIDAASLSNLAGSLLIASFAMYTYSTAQK